MIVKRLLGIYKEPQLLVYRSFANADFVYITGRVIEQTKKSSASSSLRNIVALARAYLARPFKNFEVQIISDTDTRIVKTNKNGIFEIKHPYKTGELLQAKINNQIVPIEIAASIEKASYGIISDVDDTILISNVTRVFVLLYLVFTKNAHSRKPFPGVAEFYQALVHPHNPIFYVSSTTWNLYGMLIEFMSINSIPTGPLLLKEVSSIKAVYTTSGNHNHKQEKIEMILDVYPTLQFILLGDSGQQDVEIYSAIVKKYPDRIKVIYIRDISVKKHDIIKETIQTVDGKVDVVFVKTSAEAAAHALKHGFIASKDEKEIKEGVAQEANFLGQ
ncbi:MAG: phosphatase domain-containing protein [Patescibacteria group bacterium]